MEMESRAGNNMGIMVYAPYYSSMKRILPKCVPTVKGHEPDKLFGNDITMTTDKPKRRMYAAYTPSPNINKTILSAQNLDLKIFFCYFSVSSF